MKKIIAIFLTLLVFIGNTQADIVDQLTELNELYKSGAINEDEFSKAKNIILKSGSETKEEIEEKIEDEKKIETEEKKNIPTIEIKKK
tara:strand:- start:38 stop:301 length:264 start_codon:yes stop_codon:yes gene_type:complete